MTYSPEQFSLQLATSADFPQLASLYNDAISRHQLAWPTFTVENLAEKALLRSIYKACPNDSASNLPEICAAFMLDDGSKAQPPYIQHSQEGTARLTKFVTADGLEKGFGRQVVWPHMLEEARKAGYTGLYCEALREKLHAYYRELGMTVLRPVTYYSLEYGADITVQPFYKSLPQEP